MALRLASREVNGVLVHMHTDLNDWRNRLAYWWQGSFPQLSQHSLRAFQQFQGLTKPLRSAYKTR
ncbi:hypothetical protein D3C72_2527980 [compost metagenome]